MGVGLFVVVVALLVATANWRRGEGFIKLVCSRVYSKWVVTCRRRQWQRHEKQNQKAIDSRESLSDDGREEKRQFGVALETVSLSLNPPVDPCFLDVGSCHGERNETEGREAGICAEFARSRTRFSSARDVVCTRIIWKWEEGDGVLVLPTFVLQSPEESLVE